MTNPKVLIVEDERIVALHLGEILARLGYNTDHIVSSGAAALELIEKQPPDLVLMDIHIEGDIDGIETASRIPADLSVPVVYLTSHAEDATLARARATNPYGYLMKPFSERELNATIMMALGRRACDIAVREREEKLRLALAAAELSAWEIDPGTGHILYKDHLGWCSEAAPSTVAQSFRDFLPTVHLADQPAVRTAFDRVSGSGAMCEVEFRRAMPDGHERWYRVVGRAVYAPNDRRRRIVGVSRDITTAKAAHAERQASEQSYRNLISTIDGIVWESNVRKKTLSYVSDSAKRVLGYAPADWMATPGFWEAHLHPHDAERAIAQRGAAIEAGASYEATYRMIDNRGEVVWLHEVVTTVSKGATALLRGVMVDITRLKRAEQEIASTASRLAESEQRLAAVLDTAAVGIVTLDDNHRIISFNIEAERMFGRRAADVLGLSFELLVPGQVGDLLHPPGDDPCADAAGKPGAREWHAVVGVAANGQHVPITMIVSRVAVAGKCTMTVILRDMTEVQKTEEEMRRLLEEREFAVAQGENANRAKASFLAVMSHELRTPLNAIIGFSDIIGNELLGPVGNEAYRGYIADIRRSGSLLLGIINNILDLSRIEARKDELSIRDLGLDEVWEPIGGTLNANATARGVQLRVLPSRGSSQAFAGDRNAVSHILLNLVSNSIKFTASGGTIDVGLESAGRETVLFVRDTGRGIPPDKLSEVMKPFVQAASDSYVRDAGGIGLGLAICKSLAEAMKGRIAIESRLGKGTTVRVFLPSCTLKKANGAGNGRATHHRRKRSGHVAPRARPARTAPTAD